jgi:protein-tyrosine phosphatase
MRYAITFWMLGAACVVYALALENLWLRLVLGSCAFCFFGVGAAYGFIGPRAFLKSPNGQLAPLSYGLFWPYHLLNHVLLFTFRRTRGPQAFSRISEKLYLGCRLGAGDKQELERLGVRSVLDLTCEFAEPACLRQLGAYRCVPLLDTTAPTLEQLHEAAQWIKEQLASGSVYVHCALGHGRSATFVAAHLLLSGEAATAEEALAWSRRRVPEPGCTRHRKHAWRDWNHSNCATDLTIACTGRESNL